MALKDQSYKKFVRGVGYLLSSLCFYCEPLQARITVKLRCVWHSTGVYIGTSECVPHTILSRSLCTSHVCQNGSVYGTCTTGVHIGTDKFVLLHYLLGLMALY